MPPLTPVVIHVLLSLAGGERHGYGILKDVLQQTQTIRLGPGTLYGTLQRLMETGWVEETEDRRASQIRRAAPVLSADAIGPGGAQGRGRAARPPGCVRLGRSGSFHGRRAGKLPGR